MAGTISYNPEADRFNLTTIFRATSGGTVFSANLTASTAFDLFTDTAVVNDAIYFGMSTPSFSDLYFDIGTALVGTDVVLVWEYYSGIVTSSIREFLSNPSDWSTAKWRSIDDLDDDTVGFTVTGINTVKFPLQLFTNLVTINGVSNLWVRCRIESLTSISEGGANQTTRIKTNFGRLYVEDYTEETPCSFGEISNWLLANQTHISPTRFGNCHFDFKKIALYLSSPTLTMCETIELGNYCISAGSRSAKNYLYYLRSGVYSGEINGVFGSTFIISFGNNDDTLEFDTNTKCYNSTFRGRIPSNLGGYPYLKGEFFDCNISFNIRLHADFIGQNNTLINYGTFLMIGNWNPDFVKNNRMFLYLNRFGNKYSKGIDFNNLSWTYNDSEEGYFINFYQSNVDSSYNFYDCTALPHLTDNITSLGMPTLFQTTNYSVNEIDYKGGKVFFYNSSLGTYTDYTSDIKTTGGGNVPIFGEVGDCLYWSDTTSTFSQGHELIIVVPESQTSNDYEYVWEYYAGGNWYTWGSYSTTRVIDKTNNFTNNGHILLLNKRTNNHVTTINSVSASWKRLRIITKGNGTPVITSLTHYIDIEGAPWCCDWSFNEYHSALFTITDNNLNPIQNANVIIENNLSEEVYNKLTDENGVTESAYFITKKIMFDDDADLSLSPRYLLRGKEVDYNNFKITISASGYETISYYENIIDKINITIHLRPQKQLAITNDGIYVNADPKNKTDTLSLIKI